MGQSYHLPIIPKPNNIQRLYLIKLGFEIMDYSANYVEYDLPFGWDMTHEVINGIKLYYFYDFVGNLRILIDMSKYDPYTFFIPENDVEIELD